MVIALAPIVPILAAVGVVGLIGGYLYFTSDDDDGQLAPPDHRNRLPGGDGKQGGGGGDDADDDESLPSAVVEALVGEYEDAAFHETQPGDSVSKVARQVIRGIVSGHSNEGDMVRGLRRLLNQSAWNRQLYGEPMSDGFAAEGIAVNRVFLPKHENALGLMRAGFFPKRNIDNSGRRQGSSKEHGALWIPALNHDAIRNGVAEPFAMLASPWADGRRATEPPPELFEVLRERDA